MGKKQEAIKDLIVDLKHQVDMLNEDDKETGRLTEHGYKCISYICGMTEAIATLASEVYHVGNEGFGYYLVKVHGDREEVIYYPGKPTDEIRQLVTKITLAIRKRDITAAWSPMNELQCWYINKLDSQSHCRINLQYLIFEVRHALSPLELKQASEETTYQVCKELIAGFSKHCGEMIDLLTREGK